MRDKFDRPIFILKGQNYLRYFSIVFLTAIILLGIYSIQYIGFVMLFVIIVAIFGLICIQFPFLYLFKDYLIIEKKGIVKRFNDNAIYRYEEIKKIEFEKGYINWLQLIVQTISGTGAHGGFSQPDQLILNFGNNKKKIIYRFGSRRNFEFAITQLKKEIKPST